MAGLRLRHATRGGLGLFHTEMLSKNVGITPQFTGCVKCTIHDGCDVFPSYKKTFSYRFSSC